MNCQKCLQINDILQIIIKYIKPTILINFFLINDISLDTKFTYSASAKVKTHKINKIIKIFPHMILTGLNIYNIAHIFDNLNKIVDVKIDGTKYCAGEVFNQTLTAQMMQQYSTATSLTISNFIIFNDNIFNDFKKLKKIYFHEYISLTSNILTKIIQNIKPQVLSTLGDVMNDCLFQSISNSHELKKLQVKILLNKQHILRCPRLRLLKINTLPFGNAIYPKLKECTSLRVINLSECYNIGSIT